MTDPRPDGRCEKPCTRGSVCGAAACSESRANLLEDCRGGCMLTRLQRLRERTTRPRQRFLVGARSAATWLPKGA